MRSRRARLRQVAPRPRFYVIADRDDVDVVLFHRHRRRPLAIAALTVHRARSPHLRDLVSAFYRDHRADPSRRRSHARP